MNQKSTKSKRSVRSETNIDTEVSLGQTILDTLRQHECFIDVFVHKITEQFGKMIVTDITKPTPLCSYVVDSSIKITKQSETVVTGISSALIIRTIYDTDDNLVEVSLNGYKKHPIPGKVIEVLGLLLKKYTKLSNLTIKESNADRCTLMALRNVLAVATTITDVCLDSSIVYDGSYDLLLLQATSLRSLSLRLCKINDQVCQTIATRLHFLQPAERNLLTLNLSSNDITDLGAISLAEALRSNNHLRYLNLDNYHITDCGARRIFEVLKEFPLKFNEIINRRKIYNQYLINKRIIYDRCLLEFEGKPTINKVSLDKMTIRKTVVHDRNKESIKGEKLLSVFNECLANAELDLMTLHFIDPLDHPFAKSKVKFIDGYSHCTGNFALSYLNLTYNNLTFQSVQNLHEVLKYQVYQTNAVLPGLIKVGIEGNNLPSHCTELDCINYILRLKTKSSFITYNVSGTKKKLHQETEVIKPL